MAYFTKHGTTFSVIDSSAVEISTKLPAGNYVVRFNDIKRFFLEQIEDFKLPEKMHGNDIETKTTRVLTTFNARPNNTGVLLVGGKR
jgi:hypothetical protein